MYPTVTGFSNFIDMNSETTHTEALLGYSHGVTRLHCTSNQALGVDGTQRNYYQLFIDSFNLVHHKTKICFIVTHYQKVRFASNKHHNTWDYIIFALMFAK